MGIKWSDDHLIGHDAIDRQHKELFTAFNALLEAGRIGQGKQKIEELLDFLDGYALFHFGEEKKLMESLKYPDLAEHLAEHNVFLQMLSQLRANFKADGSTMDLLVEINESLLRWIITHIRKTDTKLAAYMKSA